MTDQSIIDELLRRKKAGTLKADAIDVPCKVRPLAHDQVAEVESLLGYVLPLLLTRMYTEVANGGFGDSYGLLGLIGGPKNEAGFDSARLLKELRKPDPNDRFWKWPDGLLPIGHLGCGMYHCVDSKSKRGKIILFEPNPHEDGCSWRDAFFPFSPSLSKLMSDWLDGNDLWGGMA
jgi:hypothetical protein